MVTWLGTSVLRVFDNSIFVTSRFRIHLMRIRISILHSDLFKRTASLSLLLDHLLLIRFRGKWLRRTWFFHWFIINFIYLVMIIQEALSLTTKAWLLKKLPINILSFYQWWILHFILHYQFILLIFIRYVWNPFSYRIKVVMIAILTLLLWILIVLLFISNFIST